MRSTFEYMYETVSRDSIEIEDIGNCALECFNDHGEVYYLIVNTKLGYTEIIEFGPYDIAAGEPIVQRKFNFNYKRMDYDDYRVESAIEAFITDKHKKVTQVVEASQQYVLDKLQDVKSCIKHEMSSEGPIDWSCLQDDDN